MVSVLTDIPARCLFLSRVSSKPVVLETKCYKNSNFVIMIVLLQNTKEKQGKGQGHILHSSDIVKGALDNM